jgi:hypothetical protein
MPLQTEYRLDMSMNKLGRSLESKRSRLQWVKVLRRVGKRKT